MTICIILNKNPSQYKTANYSDEKFCRCLWMNVKCSVNQFIFRSVAYFQNNGANIYSWNKVDQIQTIWKQENYNVFNKIVHRIKPSQRCKSYKNSSSKCGYVCQKITPVKINPLFQYCTFPVNSCVYKIFYAKSDTFLHNWLSL